MDSYTDSNTEYIQASITTKVALSGSPVINWDGKVTAMSASRSKTAAISYLLPLSRSLRVLRCIQNNLEITR